MDLGSRLARLVCLAALREVESARGSQTWSRRGRLGTSGCIETALFFFYPFTRSRANLEGDLPGAPRGRGGFDLQAVGLEVGGLLGTVHLIFTAQVGFEEL